jgi:GH25 family lysozyme M1 (1,4-beta-N-acetylmuramidase)
METIGLLGLDIMFATALAMLLAEQVRLVLRRAMARRRAIQRQQGTRSAESAVTVRTRPTANDGIDVSSWPLRVWRHNH